LNYLTAGAWEAPGRQKQRDFLFIRMKEVKLGFENEAYFSRFFKKSTGFSPGEFTKKMCIKIYDLCIFQTVEHFYFSIIINLQK